MTEITKDKIDFKKLHKALSDTYKRQMEIKSKFPKRWSKKFYDANWEKLELMKEWKECRREFERLSRRMHNLCCLLACLKGKFHCTFIEGIGEIDMECQWSMAANHKEFLKEEFKPKPLPAEVIDKNIKAQPSIFSKIINRLGL